MDNQCPGQESNPGSLAIETDINHYIHMSLSSADIVMALLSVPDW
jgi:hypothetical protein